MKLSDLKEAPPCSCPECTYMCKRPCWPTVSEARALIRAGYGPRLMLDAQCHENGTNTWVLCPANKGHEGRIRPWYPVTYEGCTFLDGGKCELHNTGLKPLEGRAARHDIKYNGRELGRVFGCSWNTKVGRALVESWKRDVGYEP